MEKALRRSTMETAPSDQHVQGTVFRAWKGKQGLGAPLRLLMSLGSCFLLGDFFLSSLWQSKF